MSTLPRVAHSVSLPPRISRWITALGTCACLSCGADVEFASHNGDGAAGDQHGHFGSGATNQASESLSLFASAAATRVRHAGTRLVSHDWDMGDWKPDRVVTVEVPDKVIGRDKLSRLYLWTVPPR